MNPSEGGKARARKLSPEERSEISRIAAEARWAKAKDGTEVLRATHGSDDHPLRIGDIEIPCYVLEDGRRVISQRGMVKALGMSHGSVKNRADRLTGFVVQKSLEPFISSQLTALMEPIKFVPLRGGNLAFGYDASLLADICDAVLAARKAGVLVARQLHIADRCEILVRGFARVGIIALIDEATGYQSDRPQDALARILEQFISKELAKWAKMFPDDFYKEMFRLRGWTYLEGSTKRPVHAAQLTNDLVYERLAPGVLDELKRVTPKNAKGKPKHRLHQRLTEDIGHPRLREHLASVIALMKASTRWNGFQTLINRALPKYGITTRDLGFPTDEELGED